MPTGFGGSPGLAILGGVARGITEDEARRQAQQTEAILNRLREAQVGQAQQAITLAANADTRAGNADVREGAEETRRGTMFGFQTRAAQRGEAGAAREEEGVAATRESLIADYMQHHPQGTRADASRWATSRMSGAYVDPERDRVEGSARVAGVEHTRAATAESRAAAVRNYASAEAERGLAAERRAAAANGGRGGTTGATEQIKATAAADAEAAVQAAITALDKTTPAAAPGKESERAAAVHQRAVDQVIGSLRTSIPANPSPAEQRYYTELGTSLQEIRTGELRGQRTRPFRPEMPNLFGGSGVTP